MNKNFFAASKRIFILLTAAIISISVNGCRKTENLPKCEDFSVKYVNVGYGDAIIVSANGHHFMIDSGEKNEVKTVIATLNEFGIKHLDGIFLTHSHSDHIGGVYAISKVCTIDRIYSSPITIKNDDGNDIIAELCKSLLINHEYLEKGDKVSLYEGGSYFEVLAPTELNEDDDNDNSLVIRLEINGRIFLFTGDMQFKEEESLMKHTAPSRLKADILKVGNHGNKDATSDEFATAVSPELSIISTSTEDDKNSASKRVRKALSMSEIHITEDYDLGLDISVSPDGVIHTTHMSAKTDSDYSSLSMSDPRASAQSFTIHNSSSSDINLGGCFVSIDGGSKIYYFNEYILSGGKSVSVACRGSAEAENADLICDEESLMDTKKSKVVVFYDKYGHVITVTGTVVD